MYVLHIDKVNQSDIKTSGDQQYNMADPSEKGCST